MQRLHCQTLSLALTASLCLAGGVSAGEPPAPERAANFTLTDASGKPFALHDLKGKKAVVVVFLSFECPVSTGYAPTLAKIAEAYGPRGVAFVGVDSSDDLDAAAVARQAAGLKLPFPVLKDVHFRAADALDARTAPEAFVLDGDFAVRYHGRVDNSYAARLRKNVQTTRHDLREALDEVLSGRPVSVPVTKAVGCPIVRERAGAATAAVTYHHDVEPILQAQCQQCHRPGEVGPFSLMTYKQAVRWATDMKDYTQSRKMPPWKPVEGGPFHNERRLSDKEIATLATWADGGTPEGDPKDAPPPRNFAEGWQLGTPDLVLTVPEEMTVAAGGDDLFRCFVLPTNLAEDRYVVAYEVRPANKRVVHHTLNVYDRTGRARELEQKQREKAKPDDEDRGPGYTVQMGYGFIPQGQLGGWAPGARARTLPEGTGFPLPKGSDVVIQVHYHRTGRVEKDRTSIGLYFAKKPVERPFKNVTLPGWFWMIPPSSPHYHIHGTVELEQDCTLHSVMPHMHMLGREIKVALTPPGGKPTTLVAINDWDYNWQETYFFKDPVPVKAGTKLEVDAYYDNSSKNPNNPSHFPLPVFFGEQTTDEMCFVFLGATSDTPGKIRVRSKDRPARPKKN
jgi:peroxiredoxin